MEVLRPVQMVVIEYICDECEKGKMLRKGNPKTREIPWQYPHQCDNCGYAEYLTEPPYPRTEWRELESWIIKKENNDYTYTYFRFGIEL